MAVVSAVGNFAWLFGCAVALASAGALVNNALTEGVALLGLSSETIAGILDDPTVINTAAFKASITSDQRQGILEAYLHGFKHFFYMTVSFERLVAFET